MSAFAVVTSPREIQRLGQDLQALQRRAARRHVPLQGIWVERRHRSFRRGALRTMGLLSADRTLPLAFSMERRGVWAVCETVAPEISRSSLARLLTAMTRSDPRLATAHFIPIYAADSDPDWRIRDWTRLAATQLAIGPALAQLADGCLRVPYFGLMRAGGPAQYVA